MSNIKFQKNLPTAGESGAEGVANISGLTLWLEYDWGVFTDTALTTPAVVTNTVKGWKNRASDAYHATEATNPPTLAADGLTFDGVDDVLRIARMTGQFGAGYTVFLVMNFPDGRPAAVNVPFASYSTVPNRSYFDLVLFTGGALTMTVIENGVSVGTTPKTFADGATGRFVVAFTATPAVSTVGYYNGTAAGTPGNISARTWANIATAISEAPFIGRENNNGALGTPSAVTVSAGLIFNRPLTAAELLVIHRYLGAKYAITVP